LRVVAQEIEADMRRRLAAVGLPKNLADAVEYAVFVGGKRLRPGLVVLCCRAVGGNRADALAPAGAIELIHTFSLVHDDLPAMDDDAMRRGQPTLHVHAGEAMAILSGDVMVSLAFQFIAQSELDASKRASLSSELAQATTGMIAGQVYDTLGGFPPGMTDEARLNLIHVNKTGALLRAACRMGGICGGATPENLQALTQYGEAMGLMFQIVDDLLDVTQSAEHIGKATGKDVPAGKLTFPALLGIAGSRREIARLQRIANDAVAGLGDTAQPLRALCDFMAVRTK
jgi:geranylgeranyl pyrophosphate synthase